jgi:predicted GNAT family acetyltransferase
VEDPPGAWDRAGAHGHREARTKPGPFETRAIELGAYLGIRRGSALVAMAGERPRPQGWTAIRAVCTDEDLPGQGLGARLVRAVAAGQRLRGAAQTLGGRRPG